jgi:hypothetical protein
MDYLSKPVALTMCSITCAAVAFALSDASAERIRRAPPRASELERIASEQAMNDGDLRKGDIVATDRGFLQLRGLKEDGSYDFAPIANPFWTPTNRK